MMGRCIGCRRPFTIPAWVGSSLPYCHACLNGGSTSSMRQEAGRQVLRDRARGTDFFRTPPPAPDEGSW